MDGGHPLGIQPWGNFLLGDGIDIRPNGLGSLAVLSDELFLEILNLIPIKELGKLSVVSKAFFCFAYHEDVWRRRVLEECECSFKFQCTWRITCINSHFPNLNCPIKKNPPFKVNGFFSDLLYQSWYCANLELMPGWLEVDNIDRVGKITLEEFREKFEVPNKPVVFKNAMENWQSIKKWNKKYLLEVFFGKKLIAGGYEFSMEDYFNYSENQNDEMPLYLFDKAFLKKVPFLEGHFEIPEYFKEDLFSVMGQEDRPDYRWLIMGPRRSGSSFHKDPNATSAWNAVIKGKKKWILFPPNEIPPGVHASEDGADVATPISIIEWFLNFYEDTKEANVRPVECIVKAGEMIFVPRGWWHLALNLEESIAITQNYVSRINLPHVLKFLKSGREDLVSGRPIGERGNLHDKFISKLEEKFPEILKEVRENEEKCQKRKRQLGSLFKQNSKQLKMEFNSGNVDDNSGFKFNFM